jgi:adenylate cyclase
MDFCHKYPGGTELEISMFFVDVRGSTKIAEGMKASDFSGLMNKFYKEATRVLINHNAFIDKFVGDEVIGLFMPLFAGKNHSQSAIRAAQELLVATQHNELPLGIGVHTGVAYVGTVSGTDGSVKDITALGDNVNITARLASQAGAGEALISEFASASAGMQLEKSEQRSLELKGKSEPIRVNVLKA